MMQKYRFAALVTALTLASVAVADPAAPDARMLGQIEGILNKCAQLDPAHAAEYRDRVKLVAQGADDAALAGVRKSAVYKQAFDAATESLATADGKAALKACTDSLAPAS
ncbi:MAG: hypothetical protein KGL25_08280 [Gammaproteobacteria bacterium]|nr:hypothetical protein [Gammaproteobacteria bacterium]MDE2251388.1 hypothetical protein [Gammaproteobacteria bacterium]